MTDLSNLQQRFLGYLLHADDSIVDNIAGDTVAHRERRLSIYYNGYRARLRGTIESDHSILGIYLGDDGFEQMAAGYIAEHPSHNTSLRYFCDQLPEYLRTHAPFAGIGMLGALAEFERLLLDVFDAADSDSLSRQSISNIPAAEWPDLVFTLHPSVRCYMTTWNSVEVWQAIKGERNPPQAAEGDSCSWLLWRNSERLTEFHSMPVDEHFLLRGVQEGASFAELCASLSEWHTDDVIAIRAWEILQAWLGAGLLSAATSKG